MGATYNGSTSKKLLLNLLGLTVIICIWQIISSYEIIPSRILPSPLSVIVSFKTLFIENNLINNGWYSIKLNLISYIYAIAISLPLGFIIALIPFNRIVFGTYVNTLRYLPIPALTGIFVAIFGITLGMKVSFLTFSLIIYILPSIANKIYDLQNPANDKDNVLLQTGLTMGMNNWQLLRYVYFPYVTSKVSDEIINLTGVSWSYIVICELLDRTQGLGGLISVMSRQSRTAEVFAILFLIIMIGIAQDFLFRKLDVLLFPFKHNKPKMNLKKLILK